eukprot:gene13162-15189_t
MKNRKFSVAPHQEYDDPTLLPWAQGQAHPLLRPSRRRRAYSGDEPVGGKIEGAVKTRRSWEQRRCVSVITHAEQCQIKGPRQGAKALIADVFRRFGRVVLSSQTDIGRVVRLVGQEALLQHPV